MLERNALDEYFGDCAKRTGTQPSSTRSAMAVAAVGFGWRMTVMRKRREVEAPHCKWGDAGTGARILGGRQ